MIEHIGEILILTGPPGSGKTTAARGLAELPGSPKVLLHADDFWHFIRNGAVAPYRPEAHRQNAVVIDVLAKAVAAYAKGGFMVVLEGIVGPWFLQPFATIPAEVHYVVLRPPLDAAIRRCRERGGNTLTDVDTIAELHRQLAMPEDMKRHELPTDGLRPRETLDAIIGALQCGEFRIRKPA